MKKILLLTTAALFSVFAFAGDNLSKNVNATNSNDYPTQARVEYVFQCMHKYGQRENYDTMYGCVCSVDKIAEKIPYNNFVSTSTLAVMINTPGEKGGVFRDAPGGRKAIREFKIFIADTEKSCGLKIQKK